MERLAQGQRWEQGGQVRSKEAEGSPWVGIEMQGKLKRVLAKEKRTEKMQSPRDIEKGEETENTSH